MPKRSKQNGAGPDKFLFTVPIIGPEADAEATWVDEWASAATGSRDLLAVDRAPSVDAPQRAQRGVDRVVMGVAGGGLVGSIAFFRQIAPAPSAQTAWLLAIAWAALLAALVSALVHHHLGQRADANRITDWERTFQAADPYLARSDARPRGWLVIAASASLVVGLVCLAAFAFLNAGFA